MRHYTDEVIAHINQYTIYAVVEYSPGEEPVINSISIEPMPDVDDVTFSRDILVKEGYTMDSLIMQYLPNAKLCNQWIDEAIKLEA